MKIQLALHNFASFFVNDCKYTNGKKCFTILIVLKHNLSQTKHISHMQQTLPLNKTLIESLGFVGQDKGLVNTATFDESSGNPSKIVKTT